MKPASAFAKRVLAAMPRFTTEEIVFEALKGEGFKNYTEEKESQYMTALQNIQSAWMFLLQDVSDLDPILAYENYVAYILGQAGIKWYRSWTLDQCKKVIVKWLEEHPYMRNCYRVANMSKWEYPCPICGAETERDKSRDFIYKDVPVYWRCNVDFTHFTQYVWEKRKPILCRGKDWEQPIDIQDYMQEQNFIREYEKNYG